MRERLRTANTKDTTPVKADLVSLPPRCYSNYWQKRLWSGCNVSSWFSLLQCSLNFPKRQQNAMCDKRLCDSALT